MKRFYILFVFSTLLIGCDLPVVSDETNETGWSTASDTEYTFENPFFIAPDTTVTLPNNAGRSITGFSGEYAAMYDSLSQSFLPKKIGLAGDLRIDFQVTIPGGERKVPIKIEIDIGKDSEFIIVSRTEVVDNQFGLWYPVSLGFPFYCLDSFVANGGRVEITSTEPIQVSNISYMVKIDYTPKN